MLLIMIYHWKYVITGMCCGSVWLPVGHCIVSCIAGSCRDCWQCSGPWNCGNTHIRGLADHSFLCHVARASYGADPGLNTFLQLIIFLLLREEFLTFLTAIILYDLHILKPLFTACFFSRRLKGPGICAEQAFLFSAHKNTFCAIPRTF
jgi:hypothetical protein